MRIGQGYDVHRLVEGRKLVLGGVVIEHNKGLLGHSDADVLLHALCDALLGAAGLGDIGHHFPPEDPAFKDADSQLLLRSVMTCLRALNYRVINVDATVLAELPKLKPHLDGMCANIAACLNIAEDQVNIKATTTEGLGFVGEQQGMAAQAVALIEKV